ncbi:GL19657 [Drosophila persimilis]|uniref:GL19657 n=1 Tax=Drosophila persimilis TaxID=7234 RepID=B4G7S3_DROPE|nr:GL19657 [Drosophila persimilis]
MDDTGDENVSAAPHSLSRPRPGCGPAPDSSFAKLKGAVVAMDGAPVPYQGSGEWQGADCAGSRQGAAAIWGLGSVHIVSTFIIARIFDEDGGGGG